MVKFAEFTDIDNSNPLPVVLIDSSSDSGLPSTQVTTITSSTAETTVVTAGGTGVYNHISNLSITSSSATPTLVTLKDSTGGSIRGIWSIAEGGGIVIPYTRLKKQYDTNDNWTLTCGTSVASIYVVIEYVSQS